MISAKVSASLHGMCNNGSQALHKVSWKWCISTYINFNLSTNDRVLKQQKLVFYSLHRGSSKVTCAIVLVNDSHEKFFDPTFGKIAVSCIWKFCLGLDC